MVSGPQRGVRRVPADGRAAAWVATRPWFVPALLVVILAGGIGRLVIPAAQRSPEANLAARAGSLGHRHQGGTRVVARHLRSHPSLPGSPVPSPTPPAPLVPVTETLTVGAMVRSYQVLSQPLTTARVPALVVLSGANVSLAVEEARDDLVPYAQDGQAVLVYPVAYEGGWNAGACCGPARAAGVNDVGFIEALVKTLQAEPNVATVTLIGYSNGGRLAYSVACSDPTLVSSFAVISAVPSMACPAGAPVSLLDLDHPNDPFVSFDNTGVQHSEGVFRESSVTAEVSVWRQRDGCSAQDAASVTGEVHVDLWAECSQGTSVELGAYTQADGHSWPQGAPGTPSGAELIWSFVTSPPGQRAPSGT